MTEIEYKIQDLVNFSSQQHPVEFGHAFNSIMNSRIADAVDERKLNIAKHMFTSSDKLGNSVHV